MSAKETIDKKHIYGCMLMLPFDWVTKVVDGVEYRGQRYVVYSNGDEREILEPACWLYRQ